MIQSSPGLRTLSLDFTYGVGPNRWLANEIFDAFDVTAAELRELRLKGPLLLIDWDTLLVHADKPDPTRSFFLRHPHIHTLELDVVIGPSSSISPCTLPTLFPSLRDFFGPEHICAALVQLHRSQLESTDTMDTMLTEHPILQVVEMAQHPPRLRELEFPAQINFVFSNIATVDI